MNTSHVYRDAWRVGGWSLATKSEGVGLIFRAISFQDFQSTVCGTDPPTSQRDRRMDDT